jgi:hypothetical protein
MLMLTSSVEDLGFRVQGIGCRVERDEGNRFEVWALGSAPVAAAPCGTIPAGSTGGGKISPTCTT